MRRGRHWFAAVCSGGRCDERREVRSVSRFLIVLHSTADSSLYVICGCDFMICDVILFVQLVYVMNSFMLCDCERLSLCWDEMAEYSKHYVKYLCVC